MKRPPTEPDLVEALARGFNVISAFSLSHLALSVSEVAAATKLARPTVRRLLLTLESLGYVRSANGVYFLTPKVLELGTAYISAQGMWDIARPRLEALVEKTKESSSMSQLVGSDIVYTARVPVPKIIGMSVHIGTRFPAYATSMGRVLLSDLTAKELDAVLKTPSESGVVPRLKFARKELDQSLVEVRKRGWAMSDEQLSFGIRSIAAPVRDASGRTVAAVNVTVNAAETSIAVLKKEHLPLLLSTAAAISHDFAAMSLLPTTSPLNP
jgi:IclR family pca regulon transcriptional regulator